MMQGAAGGYCSGSALDYQVPLLEKLKREIRLVDSMHDFVGRRLEDENLPQRVRIPRKINGKGDE